MVPFVKTTFSVLMRGGGNCQSGIDPHAIAPGI